MLICLLAVSVTVMSFVRGSRVDKITIEKNVGDDVVLKCELNGTYPSWEQDKTILTFVGQATFRHVVDEERISYDKNNRDLCIKGLKISDSGIYRCMMSNLNEYIIHLNVTCCRKTLHRFVGGHATFNCPLRGNVTEWYGPEDEVPQGHHRKLHIRNLTHADAGVYKCKVPSTGTHSFNLDIHNINTFGTLTGYVGDDVILECKLPLKYPYWYSPELSVIPLMHAGSTSMNPHTTLVKEGRLSMHQNERDLLVRNLKTTDAGQYKCFMFRVGTHILNLTVLERELMDTQTTYTGSSMECTQVTMMTILAPAIYMLIT